MSGNAVTISPLWPGVPLALASAVLFGASAPFAKLLLGSTDPQLLAGLLYLGAGIGLAIVRKSAERMQGEVGLESEVGRGSRFWVELKGVES